MENKSSTAKDHKNHCPFCHKTIKGSSYKFQAHLFHQHKAGNSQFKCSYCSKEYYRSDTFMKHMRKHTGDTQQKESFICDYCGRSFVVKRNLMYHLKIHGETLLDSYKCKACGVVYCEERLLKYHIRKSHFNLNVTESVHINKGLNETWVEKVKESQVWVEMTKVNNNVLSIKKIGTVKNESTDSKPDIRDEKTKFKDYISSVFAHKDSSQYSKATCDYCKKEMLKKSLLSHIRERHLKLKKFKCEGCNKSFCRHYQLVDHVCGKTRRRRNKTDYNKQISKVETVGITPSRRREKIDGIKVEKERVGITPSRRKKMIHGIKVENERVGITPSRKREKSDCVKVEKVEKVEGVF